MVTQRHKQQSGTLYIILIFMLLSLLFMGVCFSNLLHFYVEDIYNISLNRSLLFGYEYAHSLSWLIIMTPVFVVLQLYQWYRLKKNPDFLKQRARKILLLILLIIMAIVGVFYIVGTVYSFFGGHSEAGGLWRVLITIFTLGLGVLYCAFELTSKPVLLSLGYKWALMGVVVVSVIISIWVTLTQAAPSYMREMRMDQNHILDFQEVNASVYEYFKAYNMVPSNLEELVYVGLLGKERLQEDLDHYSYEKINVNSYDLCAKFKHDSHKARRLKHLMSNKHLGLYQITR